MVSKNLKNYLGLSHRYSGINCITLIASFYKNELKSDIFEKLFELIKTQNKNISTRRWMKEISLKNIDDWASLYATKVSLTELQIYDVIVFRSLKSENPIHFGMLIDNNMRMLHLEEGAHSMITTIDNYWSEKIYAAYRQVVL